MRLLRPLAIAVSALAACGGGGGVVESAPGRVAVVRFQAPRARGSLQTFGLEGAVRGSGRVAVVFAHAFPETQASWAAFAEKIARRGFLTLTFNFRGYGLSQGSRDPARADLDLEAAVDEALRRGSEAVMVVGASMGGTAAVKAATRLRLGGIVALSAPASFRGLDALAAAPRVRAPLLLIAGERDPSGAAASARALFRRAPQPKQLEIIAGSDAHGTDLLLDARASSRVESLITTFLAEHRG